MVNPWIVFESGSRGLPRADDLQHFHILHTSATRHSMATESFKGRLPPSNFLGVKVGFWAPTLTSPAASAKRVNGCAFVAGHWCPGVV